MTTAAEPRPSTVVRIPSGERVRCPGHVAHTHGSVPCRQVTDFTVGRESVGLVRLIIGAENVPGEGVWHCQRCRSCWAITFVNGSVT